MLAHFQNSQHHLERCNCCGVRVLDHYSAEFRTRVQEYPDAWHLAAAQADIRCRSEWRAQEQRRQLAFHTSMALFDPSQPWNSQ